METDPAQSMNALLERVRAAVAGTSDAAAAGPSVGEAAEGLVRAEVDGDRVTALALDPKLLRQPIDDTARQIVDAVNAALAARPGRIDTTPMLSELRAVQEQSVAEMTKLTQAFSTALQRATPS